MPVSRGGSCSVRVARIGELRSDLLPEYGCESNIAVDLGDCTVSVWNKVYWQFV